MPSIEFFRIFNDAVNFKEFDWAESFISETNQFLLKKDKDNLTKLSISILNFFRKDYPGILETINETGKKNISLYVYS